MDGENQAELDDGAEALNNLLMGEAESAGEEGNAAEDAAAGFADDSGTFDDFVASAYDTEEGTEESPEPDTSELTGDTAQENPEEDTGSRAQDRIQSLVAKTKEYEDTLGQTQNQIAEMAQYIQQMEQRGPSENEQYLREMVTTLVGRLDQQAAAKEDEDLDFATKFQRETVAKAKESMTPEVQKYIKELEGKVESIASRYEQDQVRLREQQQLRDFTYESTEAATRILREDRVLPEDRKVLQNLTSDFAATMGAAMGQSPNTVAGEAEKYLEQYHKARLRKQRADYKARKNINQNMPPVTKARSGVSGTVSKPITLEQAHHFGFDGVFEARQAYDKDPMVRANFQNLWRQGE